MSKLLILLALFGAAVWWLGARRGPRPPRAGPARPAAPPAAEPQPMKACAHCGVHLPQEDAVVDAIGHPYCSEAHRLAGPRPPQPG
jgi:uncharacterized protein